MHEGQSWEHEKCEVEGCQMRFDPTLVADPGPHNNPPGLTGWYLPTFISEIQRTVSDHIVLAHDHTIDGVMH
jgi:hypothetical protein